MILGLRPSEGPNLPYAEPLPIDTARESVQGGLRHLADIPVIVIGPLYRLNEVQFCLPRARRYLLLI